ncbi:MAG: hypothetical protein AAGG68_01470 [Bacteroidota bacterium]
MSIVERSYVGIRVDYILGRASNDSSPFVAKARLEVSGIGKKSSSNSIEQRIKIKLNQIEKSEDHSLAAYVIAIEFWMAKAKIVQYETTI